VDDEQVVGLLDGDHLELDASFVAADEQQPVIEVAGPGDDVGFSGVVPWPARRGSCRCGAYARRW
jgi:hypothetical protein